MRRKIAFVSEICIAILFRDLFHPRDLCFSSVAKEFGMFRCYLRKEKGHYDFLVINGFYYNSCRTGSLSRA